LDRNFKVYIEKKINRGFHRFHWLAIGVISSFDSCHLFFTTWSDWYSLL